MSRRGQSPPADDPPAPRRKARVTSLDVAQLAGVSQSAVSRAFSAGSISEATHEKVLIAARKLDYVPNSIARSLTTRSSNIVAIVIGDLHNSFYTEAFSVLSARLQENGKQVLIFTVPKGRDADLALRRVLEYQVDGLIVLEAATASMGRTFLERGIPVVVFNRHIAGLMAHTVCCDNAEGGRLAAQALIASGARRFAIIYGNQNSQTNRDRVDGFMAALRMSGAAKFDVPQRCGEYTYEGGFQAALDTLKLPDRPEAIFCTDDMMAFGAMDAARNTLGMRIPEDLKIIGFDGTKEAGRSAYQLSTIRQPIAEMVDATIGLLEMPFTYDPVLQIIPTSLVARASTAR